MKTLVKGVKGIFLTIIYERKDNQRVALKALIAKGSNSKQNHLKVPAYSVNGSNVGNFSPLRKANIAPPPVEMWL